MHGLLHTGQLNPACFRSGRAFRSYIRACAVKLIAATDVRVMITLVRVFMGVPPSGFPRSACITPASDNYYIPTGNNHPAVLEAAREEGLSENDSGF